MLVEKKYIIVNMFYWERSLRYDALIITGFTRDHTSSHWFLPWASVGLLLLLGFDRQFTYRYIQLGRI